MAGNEARAYPALTAVLAKSEDRAATIAAIRASHTTWRRFWKARGGWVPQLWNWFANASWEHPPNEEAIGHEASRKPVHRESWYERFERERKESDQSYYQMLAKHEDWDGLRENGQDPEAWRVKSQTA